MMRDAIRKLNSDRQRQSNAPTTVDVNYDERVADKKQLEDIVNYIL